MTSHRALVDTTPQFTVEVWGPNLGTTDQAFHIHGVGCPDTKKGKYVRSDGGWSVTVESKREVVEAVYDPDDFGYDPESSEYDVYRDDFKFFPCCGKVPEDATASPSNSNTTQEATTMKKNTTTKTTTTAVEDNRRRNIGGHAGLRRSVYSEVTGTVVNIWWTAESPQYADVEERWVVECEDHGQAVPAASRDEALDYLADPRTVCTKCTKVRTRKVA